MKPDFAEAHYNLGAGLLQQEKPDDAVAEFRAVIRLKPNDAVAHYGLGIALRKQSKLAEAVAEFRKARDNAERGSDLARLIEGALTESSH
ncbi:MAG TPA: tetratricopeptide repeat protein [Isosphaeraceae bacterium]|nr:tetratricopeptide repeat protein [Isosphaeraceae bacterium]